MGQTTNYGFPLVDADKHPRWLTDFNGAVNSIDGAIKNVSDQSENYSAKIENINTSVANINKSIDNLQDQINNLEPELQPFFKDFSVSKTVQISGSGNLQIYRFFFTDTDINLPNGYKIISAQIETTDETPVKYNLTLCKQNSGGYSVDVLTSSTNTVPLTIHFVIAKSNLWES